MGSLKALPIACAMGGKRSSSSSLILSSSSSSSFDVYYSKPPHDTRLYDLLGVRYDATSDEISRCYRRRSRECHPDKWRAVRPPPPPPRTSPPTSEGSDRLGSSPLSESSPPPLPLPSSSSTVPIDDDDESSKRRRRRRFDEITRAYEILGDDRGRLLYHKYGFDDVNEYDDAMRSLLLGGGNGGGSTMPLADDDDDDDDDDERGSRRRCQSRLLELMGYPPKTTSPSTTRTDVHHRQRMDYLIDTIVERIRPMVEGTISQDAFVTDVHRECDMMRRGPLGSRILRCVGRAYRIEGYRALRVASYPSSRSMDASSRRHRHRHRHRRHPYRRHDGRRRLDDANDVLAMTDGVVDSLRDAGRYASAAFAGARLMLAERGMRRLEKEGDNVRRERDARRREERTRRRRRRRRRDAGSGVGGVGGGGGGGGGVEGDEHRVIADDDGNPLFSDGEDAGDPFLSSNDDHGGALDNDDDDDNYDHDDDDDEFLEKELQLSRLHKTHSALLSAHQLEALWKITKIELESTVRDACRCILMGNYVGVDGWNAFCRPSERMSGGGHRWHHRRHHPYSSPPPPPPPPPHSPSPPGGCEHYDGWVGTTGEVVTMEVGRLRSAAALILLGDLFVQCSKA